MPWLKQLFRMKRNQRRYEKEEPEKKKKIQIKLLLKMLILKEVFVLKKFVKEQEKRF